MVERGEEEGDVEARGDEVGVGAEVSRFAVGPAGQFVESGEGGVVSAAALAVGVRAVLALSAAAEHDQIRVELAQGVVSETHADHGAGGEIVEDDVGPLDEPPGDGHARLGAEVDVERSSTGAHLCELAAAFRIGHIILERADQAQGIKAGRAFDSNHIGSEVGETA